MFASLRCSKGFRNRFNKHQFLYKGKNEKEEEKEWKNNRTFYFLFFLPILSVNMFQQQFKIRNEKGLHLRAAGEFVKEASKYPCDVWIAKDNVEANAKSIMSILTLIAGKDSTITIMTEGEKAAEEDPR